jgi:hypothetical protein
LGLLLEGIDLSQGRRRKRYSLPATAVRDQESGEAVEPGVRS